MTSTTITPEISTTTRPTGYGHEIQYWMDTTGRLADRVVLLTLHKTTSYGWRVDRYRLTDHISGDVMRQTVEGSDGERLAGETWILEAVRKYAGRHAIQISADANAEQLTPAEVAEELAELPILEA